MSPSDLNKSTIKPPVNSPPALPVKPPIKLLVNHDVLVTQSFLDAIAENSGSNATYQANEVSAWLNDQGSECECVYCEMLASNYHIPTPPPNWGENKPHWYCSGGGQLEWKEHERNRRWITAYLAYSNRPKNKDG